MHKLRGELESIYYVIDISVYLGTTIRPENEAV